MTPEEMAQLQQRLAALQAQQEQALAAQAEEQARRRKAQVYGTLGAIGGAALGIGLLRLLNSDRGQEKAEAVMEEFGDQCTDAVRKRLASFLGGEAPPDAPPTFNPGDAKDADFEIVD